MSKLILTFLHIKIVTEMIDKYLDLMLKYNYLQNLCNL
jgi:hypothetical protein